MYLHELDNYSQYINNLIDQDRFDKRDPSYLKSLLKEKEKEINQINQLLKESKQNPQKIQECLKTWYEVFRENDRYALPRNLNYKWVKSRVYPELKKLGWKGKPEKILDIFSEWPEGDK